MVRSLFFENYKAERFESKETGGRHTSLKAMAMVRAKIKYLNLSSNHRHYEDGADLKNI